jgi:hypothetical protein
MTKVGDLAPDRVYEALLQGCRELGVRLLD